MRKILLVIVVVALAGPAGFLAQHLLKGGAAKPAIAAKSGAATNTAAGATGDAAAKSADAVIPDTLPDFQLADRDGRKHSLAEWKGRPLMVNYWASWCGPCRREIPLLNELRTEHKAQKLEIVGIAVDFRDDVLQYIKEHPISYPLLIGEEDGLAAVHAMGVQQEAFPFTVFADSRQRILALKLGELHRDEAEMILDRLARVDAGTLQLPEARQQITEGLKTLATKRAASQAAASGG